ncbi:major facilitator superfamily domain-containing protein [Xylariales sp. PMI_506]|nr:major facilitator superfamily domain-containing protein [Xylariales sp. PMI_506]
MRNQSYQKLRSEEDVDAEDAIPLQTRNSTSDYPVTHPDVHDYFSSESAGRASVYRLLPYFFLASLAFGLTVVPRVNVLVTLICQQIADELPAGRQMAPNGTTISMGSYDARCSSPVVTAGVAFMSTYRDLTAGIIGAIMSYYLGKLSDRVGRRKVLLLNGVGILLSELVLLLVVALPQSLDYRWLFLSFVIDGLSGSFPLLMATVSSYVIDATDEKDRVVGMGWIQSGMFCGMALGPALGSVLSRLSGSDRPSTIFIYAMACRVLGIMLLAIIPESLPTLKEVTSKGSDRPSFTLWRGASSWKLPSFVLLDTLVENESHSPEETRRARRNLILLITINAVMFGTAVGAMDVMMLYPQARYAWKMMQTSNFISIINICRTLATTVILHLLLRIFSGLLSKVTPAVDGRQDGTRAHLPLLRLSLCFDILGYIGFGVAPTGLWFILAGVVSSLGAMGVSSIQTSMSVMVSPSQVGNLMGILGSVQALSRLVSPPLINFIYGQIVSFLPQGVFLVLAAAVASELMLTYLVR